jgi:hypothetical protein
MTVTTLVSKSPVYTGNASTTAFATGLEFISNADLSVYLVQSGVQTLQVIGTQYTVSGAGVETGGTVTMVTAPPIGALLWIERTTPLNQATTLSPTYTPAQIESIVDKLTLQAQDSRSSAKIDVLQVGSGAVVRTLSSKLQDSASVLDFIPSSEHAKIRAGTSTDDWTSAFNAAIAAHRSVRIPFGIYLIRGQVNVGLGRHLYGDGRRCTLITVPSDSTATLGTFAFLGADPGPELEDFTIRFEQPNSSDPAALIHYKPAIYAFAAPRSRISRMRIELAWDGIDLKGNAGAVVIDDLELSMFNIGIDINGSLDSIKVSKLHIWPFGTLNGEMYPDQRIAYANAIGIKSGRNDDFHLSDSLIFSLIRALYFYNFIDNDRDKRGFTFGQLTNVDLDDRGGIHIVDDARIMVSAATFTMGQTDSRFIYMTGGTLSLDATRFVCNVKPASAAGFVEIIGGTLTFGPGCVFEGHEWDLPLIHASHSTLKVQGSLFGRTSKAFAAPIIYVNDTAGVVSDCYVTPIGSGNFLEIASDSGMVARGNNLSNWSVSTPGSSALTKTIVTGNLGVGCEKEEFSGYISPSALTGNILPAGWTVTPLGTGNYQLTHGLSLASKYDIVCVAQSIGLANGVAIVDDVSSTTGAVRIRTYVGNTGAATNSAIMFHIKRFRA